MHLSSDDGREGFEYPGSVQRFSPRAPDVPARRNRSQIMLVDNEIQSSVEFA